MFEQEKTLYEKHKNELLGIARGKFVLIKGDKIVDTFDTELDAVRQGRREFGMVPIYVREIRLIDRIETTFLNSEGRDD